jgi:SNF2 family DNA or RNA helicase
MVAELEGGYVTAANAGIRIMRLQQLTGGTLRAQNLDGSDSVQRVSEAKEGLLRDILEDIDEPVVIFGRFHTDLDAAHRAVGGEQSLELSGRANHLAAWQAGEGNALVVQVQSGGVGIDLTRARIAIYYSLGYSLADYMQSRARLHRPGQTRSVEYIHLIVRRSVDELVYTALAARADVVASVVEQMREQAKPANRGAAFGVDPRRTPGIGRPT